MLFGAAGISNEYPISRYFRNAKVMKIVEGTNQIQRNIMADDLLGRQSYKRQADPFTDRATLPSALASQNESCHRQRWGLSLPGFMRRSSIPCGPGGDDNGQELVEHALRSIEAGGIVDFGDVTFDLRPAADCPGRPANPRWRR